MKEVHVETIKKKNSPVTGQEALERAIIWLLTPPSYSGCQAKPFYAHFLQNCEREFSKDVETLGVYVTDKIHLIINEEFFVSLTEKERIAVLEHEVLHLVMQHLTRFKPKYHKIWNIACVEKGTKIKMYNGEEKNIENIEINDEILGDNLQKGRILLTLNKKSDKIVEIKTDKECLYATKEHKILTSNGYKEVKELKEGDILYGCKNNYKRTREVDRQKFTENDNYGYVKKSQFETLDGRWLFIPVNKIQNEKNNKKKKSKNNLEFIVIDTFIHSWDNRRRGHNNNSKTQRLLSTNGLHIEYLDFIEGILSETGFFDCNNKKFKKNRILENVYNRITDSGLLEEIATVFSDKTNTCKIGNGIYQIKIKTKTLRKTNGENETNRKRNKNLESQRIISIKEIKKHTEVYDLITTCNSYVANNVVVHNCDIAINQYINHLPKCGLTPEQFKLKREKEAEYYYKELMKQAKVVKMYSEGSEGEEGTTLDDHGIWDKSNANKDMSKTVVKGAVQQSAKNIKDCGNLHGNIYSQIDKMLREELINWKRELNRFINRATIVQRTYTRKRPNKRYPMFEGNKNEYRLKLLIGLDTSGSIEDRTLQEFFGQIDIIKQMKFEVHVAECDCQLGSTYDYKKCPTKVSGRGGTDFKPVFQYAKKYKPDIIVYLTDGYADKNWKERIPTLWVVTEGGDTKGFQFGQVVEMKKSKEKI